MNGTRTPESTLSRSLTSPRGGPGTAARIAVSLAVAAAAALPAAAATYVQFEDGRALEVRAFRLFDRIIELDLGEGSRMVLPLDGIEWIERDGRGVAPQPKPPRVDAPVDAERTESPIEPTGDPTTEGAVRAREDRIDYTAPFVDRGAAVALRPDRFRRGRDPRSPSP